MTLDPTVALAFSMFSNKGVYAVLLGSGVSRSAAIPTGWEVVLDLIRRLAHLLGEDCEPGTCSRIRRSGCRGTTARHWWEPALRDWRHRPEGVRMPGKTKTSNRVVCEQCAGTGLVRRITTYPVLLAGPLEGKQIHVGRVALHECRSCGHLMPT